MNVWFETVSYIKVCFQGNIMTSGQNTLVFKINPNSDDSFGHVPKGFFSSKCYFPSTGGCCFAHFMNDNLFFHF